MQPNYLYISILTPSVQKVQKIWDFLGSQGSWEFCLESGSGEEEGAENRRNFQFETLIKSRNFSNLAQSKQSQKTTF